MSEGFQNYLTLSDEDRQRLVILVFIYSDWDKKSLDKLKETENEMEDYVSPDIIFSKLEGSCEEAIPFLEHFEVESVPSVLLLSPVPGSTTQGSIFQGLHRLRQGPETSLSAVMEVVASQLNNRYIIQRRGAKKSTREQVQLQEPLDYKDKVNRAIQSGEVTLIVSKNLTDHSEFARIKRELVSNQVNFFVVEMEIDSSSAESFSDMFSERPERPLEFPLLIKSSKILSCSLSLSLTRNAEVAEAFRKENIKLSPLVFEFISNNKLRKLIFNQQTVCFSPSVADRLQKEAGLDSCVCFSLENLQELEPSSQLEKELEEYAQEVLGASSAPLARAERVGKIPSASDLIIWGVSSVGEFPGPKEQISEVYADQLDPPPRREIPSKGGCCGGQPAGGGCCGGQASQQSSGGCCGGGHH